jgi:uncharacterized membrane protein YkoI
MYWLKTILLLLGLFLVLIVHADEDHEQARRLKELGLILPLEKIIQAVQAQYPGRILEVELETEHGRYLYEVEILDEHGVVWELLYDAASGELLKRKHDD